MGRQTLFSVGIDIVDIFVEGKAKIATQAAGVASQLEGLRYNRGQENEADLYGLDYLVEAGYDPHGMVGLMEVLNEQSKNRTIEFFSTHPSPDNRIEKIQTQIYEKGYSYNRGITNAKDYQNIVLSNLPQEAN
jgi:predicted Zn-dependent protease